MSLWEMICQTWAVWFMIGGGVVTSVIALAGLARHPRDVPYTRIRKGRIEGRRS